MSNKKATKRYSFIYNNLVKDSKDLVGLVAYSIYKQEKIKYIRYFEKSKRRQPKTEELYEFYIQAQNRIDQYKNIAASRVNEFYDEIYRLHISDIKTDYDKKLFKSRVFGWGAAITQSIIGSLLGTIIIGAIIILLLYSRYGLEWIIQNAINTYKTTSSQKIEQLKK
ncbi:MAG: hypothetical protein IJS54_05165 [Desulfovibrio sp.]|nr:hypothetical protein [Desulfovibrio sp.]